MQTAREITDQNNEQSNGKTTKLLGGVTGKGFMPGQSGNVAGRARIQHDIKALARENTLKAFEKIVELIDSDDERIAFMAAKEVIDRGYGKAAAAEEDTGNKALTINIIRFTGDNEHQSAKQLDAPSVSIRTLEAP